MSHVLVWLWNRISFTTIKNKRLTCGTLVSSPSRLADAGRGLGRCKTSCAHAIHTAGSATVLVLAWAAVLTRGDSWDFFVMQVVKLKHRLASVNYLIV